MILSTAEQGGGNCEKYVNEQRQSVCEMAKWEIEANPKDLMLLFAIALTSIQENRTQHPSADFAL